MASPRESIDEKRTIEVAESRRWMARRFKRISLGGASTF
jgi:hypothetical protein